VQEVHVSGALATAPEREAAPPRPRRMTLEELLEGALERTRVADTAECPLCAGPLEAQADGARCAHCGSRLV
jgi:tRNA(Ile2) C34 agmatinyltransferase TiaS